MRKRVGFYPDRKDDFHNVTGAAGGDGIADSSAAGGSTYFLRHRR
jgi:hypothetical protein